MSFLNTLIRDVHTFAGWAEKELATLCKDAPTLIQIADTTLTYVGPILGVVVTAESGSAAGAEVTSVINQAVARLTAIRGVIYDAGPNPTAVSLLGAVSEDLDALLTNGHVVNPTSVSLVKKVIAEITALVNAFTPAVSK